ncbi:MAG TPA: adenylate/guanylate cyclase domain-containing protein [Syntrophales bacterium]|nr:adenylate/guanylate cyclase domain-containing protein [Syntrophales bacterium]
MKPTWRQIVSPSKWLLLALVLSMLLVEGVYRLAPLEKAEHIYSDLWHRLSGVRYTPQHVMLVAVDDLSLAQFSEDPLVFWTPLFAQACETMQKVGVTVIGIDFLFTITPEKWIAKLKLDEVGMLKNYDQAFRQLLGTGKVVLVGSLIKGHAGAADTLLLPHQDYLLSLPDLDLVSHIGYANLKLDADGHVRRYEIAPASNLDPDLAQGAPRLSLGALLAVRALGLRAEEDAWRISGRTVSPRQAANISYAGPPGTFQKISFARLLAENAEEDPAVQALRGKVVIIGADFLGMNDIHSTPYGGAMSSGSGVLMTGPEIQANIAETVLSGRVTTPVSDWIRWGTGLLLIVLTLILYRNLSTWWGLAVLVAAGMVTMLVAWGFFQWFQIFPVAHLQLGLLAAFMVSFGGRLSREQREKKFIRSVFRRYIAENVVDALLAAGKMPDLGGEKKTITVLFSDIRNFTTISEKLDAHEVVEFLNKYFESVCRIILAQGGTIDKFIGDAVMVQFGAPVVYPDHAARALRTALAMRDVAVEFVSWMSERFAGRNLPPFNIGMGIHTGEAIVGNVGSSWRMEYTVIGDTVNLASRLENASKTLGCMIVASSETLKAAGMGVKTGVHDVIYVKGRETPVEIFEVTGLEE